MNYSRYIVTLNTPHYLPLSLLKCIYLVVSRFFFYSYILSSCELSLTRYKSFLLLTMVCNEHSIYKNSLRTSVAYIILLPELIDLL